MLHFIKFSVGSMTVIFKETSILCSLFYVYFMFLKEIKTKIFPTLNVLIVERKILMYETYLKTK